MKGSLKTMRTYDNAQIFTNFNDWSDPKLKPLNLSLISPLKLKPEAYQYEQKIHSSASQSSHTSLHIEELRTKIKNGYPLLSKREIRDFKLPFHESLLQNLEEDGFIGTCYFLKDLFVLDEEWHKNREKDSSTKAPNLKSSHDVLVLLSNSLIIAEIAKLEKKKSTEIKTFLKLALHFTQDKSWSWLAEELYEQCVNIVDSSDAEVPMLEAITKYLFALFLLEVKHNPRHAKHFVEESMKLSEGKSWNASEITGKKTDILYIDSCLLLHKIYLSISQDINTVEEAIELCRNSLFWAKHVHSKLPQITALKHLVMFYLSARTMSAVTDHMNSYMQLCTELNYTEGLCEGYILLATYHDLEEQEDLVIEYMQKLLKLAQEHKLTKMLAVAHHKLAIFNLKLGKFKDMEEHATKAYDYYIQINSKQEMEETMCLTGIAHAHDIMPQYLTLILQADELDNVDLKLLILWKSLRIPFFSNKKLFQPEADINSQLKDRIEQMRNEETLIIDKLRQAEIAKSNQLSASRSVMRFHSTYASVSSYTSPGVHVSQSFMNFKRNMTTAENVSDSLI